MGDIIEYILSGTMCTGPAIPVQVVEERERIQGLFRLSHAEFEVIDRATFSHNLRGAPVVHQRPHPDNVGKLVGLAKEIPALTGHQNDVWQRDFDRISAISKPIQLHS